MRQPRILDESSLWALAVLNLRAARKTTLPRQPSFVAKQPERSFLTHGSQA
jgi:hypothetical protein